VKRNKIAALAGLLLLMAGTDVRADPSYAVWLMAHERMLAKWRHSEPRCGWTVGGYTCFKRGFKRNYDWCTTGPGGTTSMRF
jgi:hypothetical protein